MKFNAEKPTKHDDSEATGLSLERFDLLSAYLDGEVTASERQQVQYWLDTDQQFQHQYHQLLRLQQELSHLPVPSSSAMATELSEQLFHRFDRQRNQRHLAIAGGFALLAMVAGVFCQGNLSENSFAPQLAKRWVAPAQITPEPLMLALNRPLVEIPATAE